MAGFILHGLTYTIDTAPLNKPRNEMTLTFHGVNAFWSSAAFCRSGED
jgi:hypothetical protein